MDDTLQATHLDEPASPAMQAFKQYEHFSKCLLDAYAVVDMSGKILKCNALLTQLIGIKPKQILKADSIASLLALQIIDKPLQISEILNVSGPTRFDEIIGTANGSAVALNLIIGVYPFLIDGQNVGAFILLRDVTAETKLQVKYKDKATQSITDNLTGLFNRNYFADYLKNQVATLEGFPADAPQRILSVVMMDIDFFKKINDIYGHQAGDYVLANTGLMLRNSFRKTDVVARYGGEEFLAIMPATDLHGATIAAEKLRLALAAFKFDTGGKIIPVTISCGVAQIEVGKESGEEAIARADAALYFSKHNGRNRVSIHSQGAPGPSPWLLKT
jgi:diguanylate cyclase (GGDEF)-like protein